MTPAQGREDWVGVGIGALILAVFFLGLYLNIGRGAGTFPPHGQTNTPNGRPYLAE